VLLTQQLAARVRARLWDRMLDASQAPVSRSLHVL
jgi:hypothetical protein